MTLGEVAEIAAIVIVPMTAFGWFVSSGNKKITKAAAKNNSTALAGDVFAAPGSIAIGHNSNITGILGNIALNIKNISLKRTEVDLYQIQIREGSFWQNGGKRIDVKEIIEATDNQGIKYYNADLLFNTGGGLCYGGENTKHLTTNYYRVPVTRSDQEPSGIYSYRFSIEDGWFSFYCASITHINPKERIVTIEISQANAFKK